MMRTFFAAIGTVLLALFVVAVVLFALANQTSPTYSLLGNTFTVSAWIPVAITAALGIALTLLALAPLVNTTSQRLGVEREHTTLLDRQLTEQRSANAALQSRIATLEGERDSALSARDEARRGRDDARARAARSEEAAIAAIQRGTLDQASPSTDLATDGQPPTFTRTDTTVPTAATRETTAYTPSAPAPTDGTVDERPFEVTHAQNPTLGDRLRGLFAAPDRANDPNATPDNQPPATA